MSRIREICCHQEASHKAAEWHQSFYKGADSIQGQARQEDYQGSTGESRQGRSRINKRSSGFDHRAYMGRGVSRPRHPQVVLTASARVRRERCFNSIVEWPCASANEADCAKLLHSHGRCHDVDPKHPLTTRGGVAARCHHWQRRCHHGDRADSRGPITRSHRRRNVDAPALHFWLRLADRTRVAHAHLAQRRVCLAARRQRHRTGLVRSDRPAQLEPDLSRRRDRGGCRMQRRGLPRHLSGARQLHPARDWLQADEDRPVTGHHARRRFGLARRRHLVLRQHAQAFRLRRAPDRAVVRGRLPQRLPGDRGNVSAGKAGQLRRALHQDDGNWGPPWINDRIYPWRPFVYVPRAWAIDALLQKGLGQAMFAQITLK